MILTEWAFRTIADYYTPDLILTEILKRKKPGIIVYTFALSIAFTYGIVELIKAKLRR